MLFNKAVDAEVTSVSKSSVGGYRVTVEGGELSFSFYVEAPPQLGDKYEMTLTVKAKDKNDG